MRLRRLPMCGTASSLKQSAAPRHGGVHNRRVGELGMKGQIVVVTGANRGLGLELCRQLRELGANVIATARQPQSAIDLRALEVRI